MKFTRETTFEVRSMPDNNGQVSSSAALSASSTGNAKYDVVNHFRELSSRMFHFPLQNPIGTFCMKIFKLILIAPTSIKFCSQVAGLLPLQRRDRHQRCEQVASAAPGAQTEEAHEELLRNAIKIPNKLAI